MEKRIAEFNCAKMLDEHFNYPHKNYPTILVGGTDGKGSTSSMIASILMEAGYKVGTINTPGIGKRDIIKINGVCISKNDLDEFSNKVKQAAKVNNITIVRWVNVTIEAALLYFQKEKVDIAVIECCKGIATDPTNVVKPIVSVLTNVTPDHLEVFGNSYANYIEDKLGIIKSNTPCVVGEISEDIKQLLVKKSAQLNSKLIFSNSLENNNILRKIGEGEYETTLGNVKCELAGDYQVYNISTVLSTIKELIKLGYKIDDNNVILGLNNVCKNTRLRGRFQYLNREPNIILDLCHTPEAWKKVIPQLSNMKCKNLHIFVVCYNNRDVEKICKLLPDEAHIHYYFPISTVKRLRKPDELMNATNWMCKSTRQVATYEKNAIKELMNTCDKDDCFFIGGCTEYTSLLNVNFNS